MSVPKKVHVPKFSKNYIVSVYDDRFFDGKLARWNVKAKTSVPGLSQVTVMVLIILFAFKVAYGEKFKGQQHCFKVRVFISDQDGRVLDGNVFTEVDMRDGENPIVKQIEERQAEAAAVLKLLKEVANA